MLLTTENIIKKIESANYKFAKLYHFTGRESTLVATLEADDSNPLNQLVESELSLFPENGKFKIELKTAAKSTSDSVHSLLFSKTGEDPFGSRNQQQFQTQQPNTVMSGLGAFDSPLFLELERKKERLDELRLDLLSQQTELKIAQNNLIHERKSFSDEKKTAKEELERLYKKYSTNSSAAKHGLELLIGELITSFAEKGNLSGFGAKLMGIDSATQIQEEILEKSPEEQIIEKIAESIFEAEKDINRLKWLEKMVSIILAAQFTGTYLMEAIKAFEGIINDLKEDEEKRKQLKKDGISS